jgi:hypothetical protein
MFDRAHHVADCQSNVVMLLKLNFSFATVIAASFRGVGIPHSASSTDVGWLRLMPLVPVRRI